MKRSILYSTTLITSLAAPAVIGQEGATRIGVNYRLGYNISASFSGLGGSAPQSDPGPVAGGVNHEYDDGYVRRDSTGNGLGLTWNWGFDSASQVRGDNLYLSSTRALANGKSDASDEIQHGAEITIARELGARGKMRWGVEGAGNFLNVDLASRATVRSSTVRTTDTYALDGIIPFDPITSQNPYHGTFFGPGPLIGDTPIARNQQTIPGGASASGMRSLDAQVYGLRIGPYVEFPLSSKWTVGLNGGFALAYADSKFKYNETVSSPGTTSVFSSGSASDTKLLPGGYAGANVSVLVRPNTRLSAGVQYQNIGDFTQKVNGRRAKLDLGQSVFFTVGVNFSF